MLLWSRRTLLPLAGFVAASPLQAIPPRAKWLHKPRSAVPLSRDASGAYTAGVWAEGSFTAVDAPLTFVDVSFRSPHGGGQVKVRRALVDTGSEDSELRANLFKQIYSKGMPSRRQRYETMNGDRIYEVVELEIAVQGKSCMAQVSIAPESCFAKDAEHQCTDDAIIGHTALAKLGFVVDTAGRRLVHRSEIPALAAIVPGRSGTTYATVGFQSTLSGSREKKAFALVDTGSSDSELSAKIVNGLGVPLPVIADRVYYETAGGGEAYTVLEAQLTVLDQTCAAAVTTSLSSSDEPVLGHVALAALGIVVDPAAKQLFTRDRLGLERDRAGDGQGETLPELV